ncbi:hypothetical protein LBBP_03836 [Leptospira borgpetersenii serovar Ballum]|nr:hypothetical protein LBBP_03836 [Leptospira borgpetersenii serovar Ballum]
MFFTNACLLKNKNPYIQRTDDNVTPMYEDSFGIALSLFTIFLNAPLPILSLVLFTITFDLFAE